ncbi:hypothetical protein [Dankookia sp. P2]|uniref:hypothetical protein n=1 Tax=Dankookia sp. P2 TaxID=3423955 RepID=UPI003D668B07
MSAEPPDAPLPVGYRQAVVTGITVPLTFSLVYFRFMVFELDEGHWTGWWVASALAAAASILIQGFSRGARCNSPTTGAPPMPSPSAASAAACCCWSAAWR